MPQLSPSDLNNLAMGLIVCGAAFVCSGLVFLLPRGRKTQAAVRSFEESIDEIDGDLMQVRREHEHFD